jgi:hypothetical protein
MTKIRLRRLATREQNDSQPHPKAKRYLWLAKNEAVTSSFLLLSFGEAIIETMGDIGQQDALIRGMKIADICQQSDDQRQNEFNQNNNLADPMASFTDAERAILLGPAPVYSEQDQREDIYHEFYFNSTIFTLLTRRYNDE